MEIRLSGVVNDSIVDGPGIRLTVFTQGCPHCCPGCHNLETHDYQGGYVGDTDLILSALTENPLLDGVTLSGGEPLDQPLACNHISQGAKKLGLNVWAYTGYLWEDILEKGNPQILALLEQIDVLVDGPYQVNQRSLELLFCGSKNQRIIDVKKSLKTKTIVLWKKEQ
ncbi:anaerobic ribonucleoside-triphosphate reductase activating protein [Anaerotignum propionicum]|uniref:Anaerobic ribonucleoside-triphosphate reductase-activating protein n=1 Tax=Anaerotignum propionicum DSM 1682 TaxID=991789 RepID=A0A110A6R3_ANAPI|nr:anaerobic ribonucleoside-triphosphate reductase activating protein [Anaerotignum propionicum]AMJ39938.1 pyruvate formate-lyase 1-activating enzyme [Anaerotignum propionicum DSM 1682]SHE27197.1 anaerobic ribonucleoside-triphosphate reductase activating protein [[Clostridium] propionicum DSM 1682] [Anaerotignum propionicum DSM 1682]